MAPFASFVADAGAHTNRPLRSKLFLTWGAMSVRMRLPLRLAQRLKSQGMYSTRSPSGLCRIKKQMQPRVQNNEAAYSESLCSRRSAFSCSGFQLDKCNVEHAPIPLDFAEVKYQSVLTDLTKL